MIWAFGPSACVAVHNVAVLTPQEGIGGAPSAELQASGLGPGDEGAPAADAVLEWCNAGHALQRPPERAPGGQAQGCPPAETEETLNPPLFRSDRCNKVLEYDTKGRIGLELAPLNRQ